MKTKRRLTYLERIIRACSTLNLNPGLSIVRVRHDDQCPILDGKPQCRCVPDITIEADSGKFDVMNDGTPRHRSTLN